MTSHQNISPGHTFHSWTAIVLVLALFGFTELTVWSDVDLCLTVTEWNEVDTQAEEETTEDSWEEDALNPTPSEPFYTEAGFKQRQLAAPHIPLIYLAVPSIPPEVA